MTTSPRCRPFTPVEADGYMLEFAAGWHVERSKALLHWAEDNKRTIYNTKGHGGPPPGHLEHMRCIAVVLTDWTPSTVRGACELLRIALLILWHRKMYPGETLDEGPALLLVRNALNAFEHADGNTALAPVD